MTRSKRNKAFFIHSFQVMCLTSLSSFSTKTQAQGETNSTFHFNASRSFSFYDNLRKSPTATFRPVKEPAPSVGRALHIASDPKQLERDITLCHIPIFLRYSMYDPQAKEFQDVSSLSYGGTAGALMGIHHFNNGDGSVVKDLEGINERCNIRFTTEVVDTQSSPIVAVQNLASTVTHRTENDIKEPQACAVMGAAWYTVSQYMATVTGVYDLLQVSPSSSSMSMDSMSQYPLFSRTHPSDEAKGELAAEYFAKVLGAKHFGILFMNSKQGLSLQKKVMDAAVERNMTATSVAFPEHTTTVSLRNSLLQLKESGFNYFLGIFFPLSYDYVMDIAAEVGLAGPGKFWLVTGHLAESFADGNTTMKTGSNAAIGSTGIGILHDDGGPGLPQYEKFLSEWEKIQHNQEALNYINSKQPGPPEGAFMAFDRPKEYFGLRPSHYVLFSYDAIVGMGIAACQAAEQSQSPDNYFTGKEHHKHFLDHSFMGATGNVSFANNSFSRDGYSTYYFVSEIREIDQSNQNKSIFSGTMKNYFDTRSREWKPWPKAGKFVYSDQSTVPPDELPPYSENKHSLTNVVRVVCLLMAVSVMATSIGLSVFVFVKRKSQVITASQPPFLYILCMGTLVMSSAIIPITIDDSVASDRGCSIACMSKIWLMSIGFSLTFSALFSKTWRINKLMKCARDFKRATLTAADVMVPFVILFLSNVVVLSLWTTLAPLQWMRKALIHDRFGRQVESVGVCHNEHFLPYCITLFVVNGAALLLAIAEAYKARKITTEFSESKYIAMAVVCIFQALFFGVPLFFIGKEWHMAHYFVLTAVIFIICMAVLLLIFVPKILLINRGHAGGLQRAGETMRRGSGRGSSERIRQNTNPIPRRLRGPRDEPCLRTGSGVGASIPRPGSNGAITLVTSTLSTGNTGSGEGLEEGVWNSIHINGIQSLQQELDRSIGQIQILQQEMNALNWHNPNTQHANTQYDSN